MSKPISLDVLASPGCHTCHEFEEFWKTIAKDWPNVAFKHFDVTTPEGAELPGQYMIFASPGIILNKELFATGGFNKEKFTAKLKQLSL